jgi:hypothetical protein
MAQESVIMMMTNEDLFYLLQKLYPGTDNGKDYLTAHDLDADHAQTGHAYLFWWKLDAPKPSKTELLALWHQHGAGILAERELALLRDERNSRLAVADTLVERAIDQGDASAEAAARKYRQALRDVPQQPGFPDVIDWPALPA